MRSHAKVAAFLRLHVGASYLAVLATLPLARAEEPTKTGPQTEARFPPLVVPAGFKVTLFACDPLIEYPSAIAVGPRPGAIFVAVDYMTGLGTEIVRRSEVRLVEDTNGDGYADQAPVFAGGFNSIQGMTWHDGALFVMHAPFLTSLADPQGKGVATGRSDLLEGLGLTPEDNPVRLHCANGVAGGHDGWLYLALGDHGCDVKRPEGDRLVFQGGGILRCRPDGRDLHVFATGLRNIYDVALDEDLNVFVRDNENDGGTYKIRVCYSFHGADHGYPYLYEDRQREAMPPLADLGLGSSAGGACYLERQFPAEYRGNLLFCEWGKSVVRYPLAPRGSGFEPVVEQEFASGAKEDTYGFKPTDLVVQRDGTVMVSDYADGQRPKRGRGRIYHIAYVGDSGAGQAEKAAGAGVESGKWLEQLDSISYFERCGAQKAMVSEGGAGLAKVKDALAQRRLGVRGRLHAVWILAGGRESSAIDDLLKVAQSDPEPRVRTQAVRAIADLADSVLVQHRLDAPRGDSALAARLAEMAKGQDAKVVLEVCVALGRLRWSDAPGWLKANLAEPDPPLAHTAMQLVRRSGNWSAALPFLDLSESDPLRAVALAAVAERYEPVVVDGLIERLHVEMNASRRQEYAELLARVYKQPGPWVYWGYRPPPRPANTVAWERTDAIGAALDRALGSFEPAARLALLRGMQREQVPVPAETLTKWLDGERDGDRVAAILAALGVHAPANVRRHLVAAIKDSEHSQANRLAALKQFSDGLDEPAAEELLALTWALEDGPVLADALRRLATHPKLASAALLKKKLDSVEGEVRAAAIETLGELRAAVDPGALLTKLADADARVRQSAAIASGKLTAKGAIEPLLNLATDADPAVRRASFDGLRLLKERRAVPLAVEALKDWQVNAKALECICALGGPAEAGAIADFARQSPSADVVATTIRTLDDWRKRVGLSDEVARELDEHVAEIQGATGIVIRWEASGPLPAESAASIVGRLPDSGLRTLFATGAEGRLVLASKNAGHDGAWVAQSVVRANEQTDVEFLASSSGSLRIWLNGKSVHERGESQSFRVDSDRFGASLMRGDNRLVVMVDRSAAPVEFHLRLRRKSATAQHERLIQAALARPGNVERGRQTFLNVEKSQCLKCHRVGEQGERTGPELTGIGTRFSRIYIVESILEPSRTIAPSFGTVMVLLKDGRTLSGVKTAETQLEWTLVDNQGQKHVVKKSDIEEQKPSAQSTMPEGLEKPFTEQEFVDLIAYFASLKESRVP